MSWNDPHFRQLVEPYLNFSGHIWYIRFVIFYRPLETCLIICIFMHCSVSSVLISHLCLGLISSLPLRFSDQNFVCIYFRHACYISRLCRHYLITLSMLGEGPGTAQWYSSGQLAGWSGVRVRTGDGNFSLRHCVQTGSKAHPASHPMVIRGSFPRGKAAWGVKLTTYLHLVPKSWMRGAIPPPSSTPSWRGA
jgi:hypothetical protein